jgi:hypothetical protein
MIVGGWRRVCPDTFQHNDKEEEEEEVVQWNVLPSDQADLRDLESV